MSTLSKLVLISLTVVCLGIAATLPTAGRGDTGDSAHFSPTDFPISVYIDPQLNLTHKDLTQMLEAFPLPLQQTYQHQADICVIITDDADDFCLDRDNDGLNTIGCATYKKGKRYQVSAQCHGLIGIYLENFDQASGNINTLTHELLHAVGLNQHSTDPDSVFYRLTDTSTRPITPDVLERLGEMYP